MNSLRKTAPAAGGVGLWDRCVVTERLENERNTHTTSPHVHSMPGRMASPGPFVYVVSQWGWFPLSVGRTLIFSL